MPMTPDKEQALKTHLEAMKTLEGIEVRVRQQIQAHVSRELGRFLSEQLAARKQADGAL